MGLSAFFALDLIQSQHYHFRQTTHFTYYGTSR